MNRQLFFLFFYLFGLFYISPISAQDSVHIDWSIPIELPPINSVNKNPGLAGAFIGIHNNVLLIAGGANFPNGMPWEGGKKIYWDDIYVLHQSNGNKFNWIYVAKFKLKYRIAYGASVTTPNGVVCVGGENENGPLKTVFLLQYNTETKKIVIKDLPELPCRLTNLSAAVSKKIVYVAGGELTDRVSDKFFYLDLNKITSGWKELSPIPKQVSHAVMVVQSNSFTQRIYLIGGRKKNSNGISELYKSVLEFDLEKNIWSEKQSLPYVLSAGTGIAFGSNYILMFGGDKGETFHKSEELAAAINNEKIASKKEILNQQKIQLQLTHPGFSNEVLLYNTKKNEWKVIDKIPYKVPATTTAIKWGNKIFIPGGEIKAGVRTAQVLMGKLNIKKE